MNKLISTSLLGILTLFAATSANAIVICLGCVYISVSDSTPPADDQIVTFGDVAQGTTSTQTVTVSNANNSDGDLVIGILAAVDTLGPAYSLSNDQCSGRTLPGFSGGAPCTVDVVFAPQGVGAVTDSFDIPSNSYYGPITVTLSGNGTPGTVPDIAVTDSVAPAGDLTIPFGSLQVGQTANQTVTVANNGSANLTLGAVGAGDALAAPFSLANDACSNATLVPAATCTFNVRFQPTAAVVSDDSVAIPSDDPDEVTVTVNVSGTGTPVPVPNIVVSNNVNFGSVDLGDFNEETLTVTNSGTADLVIGDVGGTNALEAPFSVVANNCSGQTLAPDASCNITLDFTPDTGGAASDSFNIPSNDPDAADVTVNTTGTGSTPGGGGNGSAIDPATLLGLGLAGLALKRRRRGR